LKEDPKQIQVEPSAEASSGSDEGVKEKKKKSKKKSVPKGETEAEAPPKKVAPKKQSDDILDELDMDF
jgi:hypothetical protein